MSGFPWRIAALQARASGAADGERQSRLRATAFALPRRHGEAWLLISVLHVVQAVCGSGVLTKKGVFVFKGWLIAFWKVPDDEKVRGALSSHCCARCMCLHGCSFRMCHPPPVLQRWCRQATQHAVPGYAMHVFAVDYVPCSLTLHAHVRCPASFGVVCGRHVGWETASTNDPN